MDAGVSAPFFLEIQLRKPMSFPAWWSRPQPK
jgi:hypothetical protein